MVAECQDGGFIVDGGYEGVFGVDGECLGDGLEEGFGGDGGWY